MKNYKLSVESDFMLGILSNFIYFTFIPTINDTVNTYYLSLHTQLFSTMCSMSTLHLGTTVPCV